MMNPLNLPDWVPWWAQLLLVIVGILIFLALVSMPFSVFGLKSRLDLIEARLDEIQSEIRGEIRAMAARLPERRAYDDAAFGRAAPQEERGPDRRVERMPDRVAPAPARAPVLPPAWAPDSGPRRPIGAGVTRQEPSLSRPREEPRVDRSR